MTRLVFCAGIGLLVLACLGYAEQAVAVPPRTGLESPVEGRKPANSPHGANLPAGAVAVDAYGKPVVPYEVERKKINRPSAGAYGGYESKPKERPLPDPNQDDAPAWTF